MMSLYTTQTAAAIPSAQRDSQPEMQYFSFSAAQRLAITSDDISLYLML